MAGGGWLVRRDPDELVIIADQALAWELSPAEFAELNARWYLARSAPQPIIYACRLPPTPKLSMRPAMGDFRMDAAPGLT